MIYVDVSTQYWRVLPRKTDGQTYFDSVARAMHSVHTSW